MTDKNWFKNFIYRLRYQIARDTIKRVEWPSKPDWELFRDIPSYRVISDYMYNKNSYSSLDCVEVKDDGLHLKVINLDEPEYREHWSGNHWCYYKNGWIEIHDAFESYGTWVVRFTTPIKPAFPAVWFLREPHPSRNSFEVDTLLIEANSITLGNIPQREPKVNQWVTELNGDIIGKVVNYNMGIIYLDRDVRDIRLRSFLVCADSIQPEVDLMEIWGKNRTWFGYAVHWGSTFDKYDVNSVGTNICKAEENREYEFAVKMSPEKYEFFVDGIKTAEFIQGLSDRKLYMVINSAVLEGVKDKVNVPDLVIKSVKYYKL